MQGIMMFSHNIMLEIHLKKSPSNLEVFLGDVSWTDGI